MDLLAAIIWALGAYCMGSIPPAYYLVRLVKGVDLREVGSKNVGTLNTYHQVGLWGAGLVLLIDMGKGALAVLAPEWLGAPEWMVYITALMVIVGHNWTFLLDFRGGKGAASVIGIGLAALPLPTLLAIVPGVAALLLTRNAIIGLTVGYILFNLLVVVPAILNLKAMGYEPSLYDAGLCLMLTLLVATSYSISIRSQLMNALRYRQVRDIFYGP